MWFIAKAADDPAVFWIYETYNRKKWVKANTPGATIHLANARELESIKKIGQYPCFSKPLPRKDL
jgi:hypothetical protein